MTRQQRELQQTIEPYGFHVAENVRNGYRLVHPNGARLLTGHHSAQGFHTRRNLQNQLRRLAQATPPR